MYFSSIVSMWFALALPLIVLMYLLKRKYEDTLVPSHLLWNRVLKELEANQLWQRLNVRLLLILQLLAAAFLVLAIAQPMIAVSGKSYAHAVLIVDRSASMQALAGEGESRFELAKQQAIDYVMKGRADQYSVVVTGTDAELLIANTADTSAVVDAIRQAEIDFGTTDVWQALSIAESLAVNEDDGIIFFTDGLWPDQMTFNRPVTFISPNGVSEEGQDGFEFSNVFVSQFGVKQMKPNEVTGSAVIGNVGRLDHDVMLSLYVDDQLIEVKQLTVSADNKETVFFASLPRGDVYKLELDAGDAISSDNVFYAFLSSDSVKTALIVGYDGLLFLQRALELAGLRVVQSQLDDSGQYVFPNTTIDLLVLSGVQQEQLGDAVWENQLHRLPVWSIGSLLDGTVVTPSMAQNIQVQAHSVTAHILLTDTFVAEAVVSDRYIWPALTPIVERGNVPLMFVGEMNGHRKLLFTFQLTDSDLPLRMDFPIIVHNAVHWLVGESRDQLGTAVAGAPLTVSLQIETAQAAWEAVAIHASSAEIEARDVRVTSVDNGDVTAPKIPGLYRFVEQTRAGEPIRARYLHVRSDPTETEMVLTPIWERVELDEMMTDAPGEHGTQGDATNASRHFANIAALFAVIALIIVVLEWGVYQRARSV